MGTFIEEEIIKISSSIQKYFLSVILISVYRNESNNLELLLSY